PPAAPPGVDTGMDTGPLDGAAAGVDDAGVDVSLGALMTGILIVFGAGETLASWTMGVAGAGEESSGVPAGSDVACDKLWVGPDITSAGVLLMELAGLGPTEGAAGTLGAGAGTPMFFGTFGVTDVKSGSVDGMLGGVGDGTE